MSNYAIIDNHKGMAMQMNFNLIQRGKFNKAIKIRLIFFW